MSGLEGNKIAAALLTAGTIFVGANIASSHFIFGGHGHHFEPSKHYDVPAAQVASAAAAPTGPEPIAGFLAGADAAKGESIFSKKCATCHVNADGAKLKAGPNLWDVVGRDVASTEYPKYSSAFKKIEGKAWTHEELSQFLYKPKSYIKGTSMGFAGLKKDADRAAIIAYLNGLSNAPQPL